MANRRAPHVSSAVIVRSCAWAFNRPSAAATKIMRKLAINTDFTAMLNDPDIQAAALCSQCGVCEMYACPMGLQPCRINMLVKIRWRRPASRYAKGTGEYTASPDRDGREANGFSSCRPGWGWISIIDTKLIR